MGKDLSLDLWENFVSGMGYPDVADYDPTMTASFFKPPEGIDCYPAPGPFLPCNDLFDWWTLRCGVWIVFLLALLGNGCVVFVLSFSRSKIDVPRFLVCNLAMADFFMGLYLGNHSYIISTQDICSVPLVLSIKHFSSKTLIFKRKKGAQGKKVLEK